MQIALGMAPEHDTKARDGFTVLVRLSRIYFRLSEGIHLHTHSNVHYANDTVQIDKQLSVRHGWT